MRGRRIIATCPYCGSPLSEDAIIDRERYRIFNCGTYVAFSNGETTRICSNKTVQKCYNESCTNLVVIRNYTGFGSPKILCERCKTYGAQGCSGYTDFTEDGAGLTVQKSSIFK